MSRALILLSVVLLPACGFTPEGQAVRLAVKEYGAMTADAELENLEWGVCRAVSVGAVERRYPKGSKKRQGWDAFCE